jgi:capsular polysaccharide biosynthesis protein
MSSEIIPRRSPRGRRLASVVCGTRFDTLSGARTGIAGEARMRQDTLGLSRFRQFVLMGVVGEVAVVGLITGIVFAALHPPMLTSTVVVLLPQPPPSVETVAGNGAADPYMGTQEVIADSGPVLAAALPEARPAMSLAELRGDVQIKSVTNFVMTVSATGRTATDAEATANAVAAVTSSMSVLRTGRPGA